MRPAFAIAWMLAVAVGAGCSVDPAQATNDGYDALGRGDAEAAVDCFADALGRLEAGDPGYKRARMGEVEAKVALNPAAAAQSFLDYAGSRPEEVLADDYHRVGSQLSARGAHAPAVDVLHAGIERFADDAKLLAAMELTKAAVKESGDDDVLKKLAGFGYL